ncbi:hypothetical protein FALBO_10137 [Fusarium albosuccineum]|uniref:Uncharacterized protein n=1 Tax=Fusarium albosuccineum TaxID=1237068 RepID=A0A8H4L8G9_9HYPO|nr:hypothetical protein FALBO_10137 [Fusarium albosuccineum]
MTLFDQSRDAGVHLPRAKPQHDRADRGETALAAKFWTPILRNYNYNHSSGLHLAILLRMQQPSHAQVPQGHPTPTFTHQSDKYSEQMNAWLREDRKDMPWHHPDSIATTVATPIPQNNPNHVPSQTAATQGSAK